MGILCLCLLNVVAVSNLLAQAVVQLQNTPIAGRQELFFDQGWRFHRGGTDGAEATFFDDSGWRPVDLPHDWSIENLPGTESPFDRDAISQVSGGFTVGGTGWYRKTFTLPSDQKGRRVNLQFDGAYMNAAVWLNGHSLGTHPYGYTPFWFDVTKEISFATNNILAVKISNIGENSRWYSGSGLYRHVWLKFLDPVHVMHDGIYLTTPQISLDAAKIRLRIQLANQTESAAPIRLVNRIVSNRGEEVASSQTDESIGPNYGKELTRELTVTNPVLWSVDQPVLYTNITEILCGGRLADRVTTPFGIRQISFDAEKGFCLNGQPLKLQGGCLHGDNGPLGAASYDRAEERKLEILKASGFNAVRCAHNPPAPAFLDACDRLGILVLDEAFDVLEHREEALRLQSLFQRLVAEGLAEHD